MAVRLLRGDCRELLKTLPDDSVHCCITSPPYWGLRRYLPADHPDKPLEIGSEPTLQDWVRTMAEVFEEVRRVLRPDGLLFLNLGDAYAGSWGAQSREHAGKQASNISMLSANQAKAAQIRASGTGSMARTPGLKPKDLMGQPWRVAFALQDAGWWLRQELIWRKLNPMPESTRDRFTKAHEHVFMLAKSPRYHFDQTAIAEPCSPNTNPRRANNGVGFGHGFEEKTKPRAMWKTPDGWDTSSGDGGHGSFHKAGREKGRVLLAPEGVGRRMGPPGNPAERKLAADNNGSFDEAMAVMPETRNPRDVFAANEDEFLQFLAWKAAQAVAPSVIELASEPFRGAHYATFPTALIEPLLKAGCPVGGTVLDPFGGSGTTGLVADRLGRDAILMDLDERNVPMARDRLRAESSLFAEVS